MFCGQGTRERENIYHSKKNWNKTMTNPESNEGRK
jgi:hypothetical protein